MRDCDLFGMQATLYIQTKRTSAVGALRSIGIVCVWGDCLRGWQADSRCSLLVGRHPVRALVKAHVLLCDPVVHCLSAQNHSFLIASLRRFGWDAALLLPCPLHVSLHRYPEEVLSICWSPGRRLLQQS